MPAIVSVLIPTYNRKDLLKIALESVLNQDYPHLEIVVSDNASTDGTGEFVKSYNDTRIKYIKRPENIGAGRNFQEGFKDCTGKYFFCLNDDDFLTNKAYFSKAVQIMQENPNVSLVRAIVLIKSHVLKTIEIQHYRAREVVNGLEYFQNFGGLGYENFVCWFCMARREQIADAGGIFNHYSADTFMNLTACFYGDIYFLPEIIGQYNNWGQDQGSFNYETIKKAVEIPYITHEICNLARKLHPTKMRELSVAENHVATVISYWSLTLIQYMQQQDNFIKDLEASNMKSDFPEIYKYWVNSLWSSHPQGNVSYGIKQSAKFFIQAIIQKVHKILGK